MTRFRFCLALCLGIAGVAILTSPGWSGPKAPPSGISGDVIGPARGRHELLGAVLIHRDDHAGLGRGVWHAHDV